MEILIVIIILILILVFVCKKFNYELTSPAFIYTAMFIILMIVAFIYKNEWWSVTGIGLNTMFVLVFGNISFVMGTLISDNTRLTFSNRITMNSGNKTSKSISDVNTYKHILFLLFQLFTGILMYNYMSSLGKGKDFSAILGTYRNETVAASSNLPGYLSNMGALSYVGGILYASFLAECIIENKKKSVLLVILNLLVSMVISCLGGSRGSFISLVVSLICFTLMKYSNKNNWKKNIPIKILIISFILIGIVIFEFKNISELLGQSQVSKVDLSDYLILYMGAEVKNLDLFLNSYFKRSVIWGQETFRPIIQIISSIIGNKKWASYSLIVPFRYFGGKALGNVYTTYYAFIRDFGYIGVIILPFIIGFISHKIYKMAKISMKIENHSMIYLIYGVVYYACSFSYFSNIFFQLIVSTTMLKYIIFIYVLRIYFLKYNKKIIKNKIKGFI